MVENAVGVLPLPIGAATGFVVDGRELAVPLAVEEPSVVAAASHAARIVAAGGGFVTEADESVMEAFVYLEGVDSGGEARLGSESGRAELEDAVRAGQVSLERRGGGFRGLSVARLPSTRLVALAISIDVRDAMGANLLNTAAEAARPVAERISGGRALMCILSNESPRRLARAAFSLPFAALDPFARGSGAAEAARRVVLARDLAEEDPRRAVTHNKGIMNGVAALAQATMNDTRAVEAAAHAWSARTGRLRPLSAYSVEGESLRGSIELPLALGVVGGSVDLHPAARAALRLLGNPDSRGLARITAALGLAQNFAALLALVTGGIQGGHMKLHAARLAYKAGARGDEPRRAAELMAVDGEWTVAAAARALATLRANGGAVR
jgi:hydroxymethylglutaryl-CoA reductase